MDSVTERCPGFVGGGRGVLRGAGHCVPTGLGVLGVGSLGDRLLRGSRLAWLWPWRPLGPSERTHWWWSLGMFPRSGAPLILPGRGPIS